MKDKKQKKTGKIRGFRPDEDVKAMLEAAMAEGGNLSEIVNSALREQGPDVLREMVKEYRAKAARIEKSIGGDKGL